MGKGIKKSERAQQIEPVSLGELIHAQVRGAIEAAVHEELAGALGAAPYERNGGRRGYRNGVKARTLTGPTGAETRIPMMMPTGMMRGLGRRCIHVPLSATHRGAKACAAQGLHS